MACIREKKRKFRANYEFLPWQDFSHNFHRPEQPGGLERSIRFDHCSSDPVTSLLHGERGVTSEEVVPIVHDVHFQRVAHRFDKSGNVDAPWGGPEFAPTKPNDNRLS